MSQLILGVHCGSHDGAAAVFDDYSLKAAISLERLTRKKGDGSQHPEAAIDEALAIAGATRRDVDVVCYSRSAFPSRYFRGLGAARWLKEQYRTHVAGKPRRAITPDLIRHRTADIDSFFDTARMQKDGGFRSDASVYFYNHHEAHALPTLFYSPWDNALLVTADGGGDTVNYNHRRLAEGALTTIYGGEERILIPPEENSLGKMYSFATKALGFRRLRHEGKVTGLAAMGEPLGAAALARDFSVDEAGLIHSRLRSEAEIKTRMRDLLRGLNRNDFAASVQKVLEDVMLLSVERLLRRHPARHLGVSGGVFANVTLNRKLAEKLPLDEIFIFPAMGDDGLSIGGPLSWLLKRDGLETWLERREPMGDLYLGRDYDDAIDQELAAAPGVRPVATPPAQAAAARLTGGEIGAVYTNRMEFGPRALGARSILADPSRRATHDLLNARLDRSDFMPFAPVVTQERAAEVFDITSVNARAARYMTITCGVRPAWRARVPAVVHVDNSARPQIIARSTNPLYYDILASFERANGLPVLINTSFNVHEEPIVNTPLECVRALVDGRIDFVATNRALYERASAANPQAVRQPAVEAPSRAGAAEKKPAPCR
jgi:carbamoyltransferase